MKLSAVEKKRPAVGDYIITAVILIIALSMIFLRPSGENEKLSCTVSVDGELVAEYSLFDVESTKTVTVEACKYPVTVVLEKNRVRISESECPNGDCVACSWADKSGEQIICLPNRLIISVIGGTAQTGIDAVTGG